ncbi:MAG: hypothetical protein RIT27_678 [Pseudomonadota bacterium]|jgi:lipid II:glycine glycyltransferase (peptidoglycan interpeptide bridge formation enzyme)
MLNFEIEIDNINAQEWSVLLEQFDDASLYQTWSYGAVRWGEQNLSHLLLKKNNEVVAMAQLRIVRKPLMGGIAYLRWGGLWQKKNQEQDIAVFRAMISALKEEYAKKRGLWLRILPNIRETEGRNYIKIMEENGFQYTLPFEGGRTLYVDLNLSLEELRKNLQSRWRNYLKKVEQSHLKIIDKSQEELYDIFSNMYKEMHHRKNFLEYVDIEEYRKLQFDLPSQFKMKVLACELDNIPQAAIICAALGNMGIYVLGATSDDGLKNRGSYLLHWKMIEWLKNEGYRWYDLGGIDPEKVPGTAQFKYGLAGKTGIDSQPIGQFDICFNPLSKITIKIVDNLRFQMRWLKEKFNL